MDKIKNIFITATIGFFLVTLLSSCHKYSEDPFISLRPPMSRLNGGKKYGNRQWKFTSYQIYGVEHSHDFDSFLKPYTLTDLSFYFLAEERSVYRGNYCISNVSDAFWTLNNDKDIIFYGGTIPRDSVAYNFYYKVLKIDSSTKSQSKTWTIVELYNRTLHISANGTDIYFKRQ